MEKKFENRKEKEEFLIKYITEDVGLPDTEKLRKEVSVMSDFLLDTKIDSCLMMMED